MTDKKKNPKTKIRKDFEGGIQGKTPEPLFLPEELDLYTNKITNEAFIFHSKKIDYQKFSHMEYDPILFAVDVIHKDGTRQDLGIKIQWIVRPYFSKAKEVNIIRTQDKKSVDGIILPLKQIDRSPSDK